MEILYIIGNGFDLHHDLPTRYSDFCNYLKNHPGNSELKYNLELCFAGDIWADFEKALGEFDIPAIIDDDRHLLPDEDSDRDGDRYRAPDYAERLVEELTTGVSNKLNEWILSIEYPENIQTLKLPLDTSAYFLSFNYTKTLEGIYKIPTQNILHVHNIAKPYYSHRKPDDPDEEYIERQTDIIIGHSVNPSTIKKPQTNIKGNAGCVAKETINKLIEFYSRSEKKVQSIISLHRQFFDASFLSQFNKIIIIGHSLSDVDMLYFDNIAKLIVNNVQYVITYYGKKDIIQKQANSFVGNNQVTYIDIENDSDWQYLS